MFSDVVSDSMFSYVSAVPSDRLYMIKLGYIYCYCYFYLVESFHPTQELI